MFRPISCIVAGAMLCLCACASHETAMHPSVKNPTVITVARDGAIRVDHRAVPLKNLAATLKSMGITANSKFKIEGENGSDPKDIDQVLEVLVDNGLLPKNTID